MKKMISFLIKNISIRIVLILIFLLLLIFISNYSYISFKRHYSENEQIKILDSIGKMKVWDTSYQYKNFGVDSIFVRTKFLNDKMYFRVWFDLNEEESKIKTENIEKFVLDFIDKEKFSLFKINLNMNERTDIVDSLEKVSAFSFEGSHTIDKKVYLQLNKYNILYHKN